MSALIASFLGDDQGQDIAEYAVMLAVILVLVVGTIRLGRFKREQRVLGGSQRDSVATVKLFPMERQAMRSVSRGSSRRRSQLPH